MLINVKMWLLTSFNRKSLAVSEKSGIFATENLKLNILILGTMVKYVIKREYTTKVFVKGVEVESVTSSNKETVIGDMETVAYSMDKANDYIKSLRVDGLSFGEQRYDKSDVVSLGCSFAVIHHRHETKIISFFLSQFSERISD
jgi:hypothetical protein